MDGSGLPETRSTCPYCGVGCGVLLRADGQGGLDVRGDPDHPANYGRLCSKGLALGETLDRAGRLTTPQVFGQDSTWDEALALVANRFRDTIDRYGPDSVAFYVSGQMLNEDYYVANKLMKGFIGSANIDTNSRLCMASAVAGHKRAFGTDTVPGTYEDLDQADLVVLVGSNLAWCHPVLYQRLMAARDARGTRIVVIDPRRTASCDQADLHLALDPGSDVAVFNRLLSEIAARGATDPDFLTHVSGFEEALATAQADAAAPTGLTEAELSEFCRMWIGTERVVTIFSQGVNQSTAGSDKVNAILNCHLATGRIGRPGMGPLSVTGQPNAMGGREVGGLANMLACHLDLENPEHRGAVRGFWDAPHMPDAPGMKAVDLFQAVADRKIRALWIIYTNPAVTMPLADQVRDAIADCFTVVSDITAATDTARLADVLLPASAWAEKSGTVTNSDRMLSRQRAVLPPPGQARPDWEILADFGRHMGWSAAFDYPDAASIFREHAALSGIAAGFGRDFDISALSDITATDYDAMAPARWPISQSRRGGRFFGDGKFFHPDGKARALPVRWRPPAAKPTPEWPLRLNTGRNRDQWHTMTRTALSPRLSSHLAEPYLDIHPADAAAKSIAHADLVKVSSPHGTAILRARLTDTVKPGQVFAPMHWTGETAPSGRIDALVPAAVDPVSGQPESKAAMVRVERYAANWYAFAISRRAMTPAAPYWALARTTSGYRAELAGLDDPDWPHIAAALFNLPETGTQSVEDHARGTFRIAYHSGGVMDAALFASREPVAVMRDYLATLPGREAQHVLSGLAPADRPDPGPVVCSCFDVGINTIVAAIESGRLTSVDMIGAALNAGTNCGSCRPELAALLMQARKPLAAE